MKLTLEQVKALSDEELRVKVAEFCGYVPTTNANNVKRWGYKAQKIRPPAIAWTLGVGSALIAAAVSQ